MMLIANEQLGRFSFSKQNDRKKTDAVSDNVVKVKPLVRRRPSSSISRETTNYEKTGKSFDQKSIVSAPGQLLVDQAHPPAATGPIGVGGGGGGIGGNLSSKSFWNMEMLKQREEVAKVNTVRRQSSPATTLLPQIQVTTSTAPASKNKLSFFGLKRSSSNNEILGRPISEMEFRSRTRSSDMEKPPKLSLLDKRHSLVEETNTALLSKHIQPGLISSSTSKPKQNKSLNGLYGVPPTAAGSILMKKRKSLPPLTKSHSDELPKIT